MAKSQLMSNNFLVDQHAVLSNVCRKTCKIWHQVWMLSDGKTSCFLRAMPYVGKESSATGERCITCANESDGAIS